MSKYPDRSRSALIVIDVQVGVVGSAWRRDEVIANINAAVAKARLVGTPVVWVQHSDDWMTIGSDDWQLAPELQPLDGEPIIHKKFRSSFEETNLAEVLEQLAVGHVYICGSESDNCVRHTSHAALEKGFDVTLIEDAHTTSEYPGKLGPIPASAVVDELNRAFSHYRLPDRSANIVPTAELVF